MGERQRERCVEKELNGKGKRGKGRERWRDRVKRDNKVRTRRKKRGQEMY